MLAGSALVSGGCNPAAGLHGQWQLDSSKLQGGAAKLLSLTGSKVQLEFKADGTCSATAGILGQSRTYPGQWRFVKKDGNALVINVKMEGDAEERELRVTLTDDDHLEMPLPVQVAGLGDQKVPLIRVKPN